MPDAKFSHPESGYRYANATNYREIMRAALGVMQRQVGEECYPKGIVVPKRVKNCLTWFLLSL